MNVFEMPSLEAVSPPDSARKVGHTAAAGQYGLLHGREFLSRLHAPDRLAFPGYRTRSRTV